MGLLGGTFDPIHFGHLTVAESCRNQLDLEEVWIIPASTTQHRSPALADPSHRLRMVQLAVTERPSLIACAIETERGGTSYTIDTVAALQAKDPGRQFLLLMGWDAAVEIKSWRDARRLVDMVDIVVFNRDGMPAPRGEALAGFGLPPSTRLLQVPSPPISATDLRRRLASGEDVSNSVPASVLAYIAEHGLYRQ